VVLPTFGPSAGTAGPSAVAVVPSAVPATPGVIADQPAPVRASNVGLAFLFGAIALVLAAAGIGLLAVRRRSPELR
jgi:hypothetical protein